jgi:DNA-binding NarL/FixJ family response regulator
MGSEFRVAIVDGDADILFGRRAVLESQAGIKVVLEEDNANRALERLPEALVDVILVDQRLQGNDGAWLVENLSEKYLASNDGHPVIIMTAPYFDGDLLIASIRAGAADLVTQDSGSEQLIQAVFNAVHKEKDFNPETLLRTFNDLALAKADSVLFLLQLGELSDRERDVLRFLIQGISEYAIADRIDAPKYRVKKILDELQARCGFITRNQLLLALFEAEGRIAL